MRRNGPSAAYQFLDCPMLVHLHQRGAWQSAR